MITTNYHKILLLVVMLNSACDKKPSDLLSASFEINEISAHETIAELPPSLPKKLTNEERVFQLDPPLPPDIASPLTNVPLNTAPVDVPPPFSLEDELDDDFPVDVPLIPVGHCGNGRREHEEICDDGNVSNDDACNSLCGLPFCGNGVTEKGEQCDDANDVAGDGCSPVCLFERCQNGHLDRFNIPEDGDTDAVELEEQCDDGNDKPGDGCSPCCLFEQCGNGIVDFNEQCDDGNKTSGDGCSDCCLRETTSSLKK